jgi:hypothetical protein
VYIIEHKARQKLTRRKTMSNVLDKALNTFPEINDCKVSECFMLNNELYMTSEYDIDNDVFLKIEKHFSK